jgi:signal transduction histidine kinase
MRAISLMPRSLSPVLCAFFLLLGPTCFGQERAPLTNCLSVLKLTTSEAAAARPVRVRGTVTLFLPGSQLFFVQDESAGIYIFPAVWPKELAVGEVVEVSGSTGTGLYSPIIQQATIRPIGQKKTLRPQRIAIEELNTGRFDCQLVELLGVVQKAETNNIIGLDVATGGSFARVLIFTNEKPPTNLVDSLVRVRGVAGTRYSGERLAGFVILLQDLKSFENVRPAPPLFSQPIRSTGKLTWYSPEGTVDHRMQVRGTVTMSWPGESFFVQDRAGSIRVTPSKAAEMPKPGDLVEAVGFVRHPTGPGTALVEAVWRTRGSTNVPAPTELLLGELGTVQPKGQLVTAEGFIASITRKPNGTVAVLEGEGGNIRLYCNGPIPEGHVRSTVRVVGNLSTPPGKTENTTEPCLWIPSTEQITVLKQSEAPSSAAAPRGASSVLLATAVSVALIFGALFWAAQKNARQTNAATKATAEQLENAERELAKIKEARDRLGRDLHDHIIQSIYAIGLNLEDSRQTLANPEKVDVRIKGALAEINEVIRQLRNVILGLETSTIQPGEFRTALKSLAVTLGLGKSNRVRLDIDQPALDALSPAQATELVHIAREAMSNSIRHGQAETTTIRLHTQPDSLQFMVEDDGKGFDPKATDAKGYGLRNMAKRAEDLGAKFTIDAQEGVGTRIVLDIPKQKQHFSSSESHSRPDR